MSFLWTLSPLNALYVLINIIDYRRTVRLWETQRQINEHTQIEIKHLKKNRDSHGTSAR